MTTLIAIVLVTAAALAPAQENEVVAERMTRAKLEADLGNFEAASEAFAVVAQDAAAPAAMRWEALVRRGLARYAAGDVQGSRTAFRGVKESYSGDAAAIRFLTFAVATSIPGKNWIEVRSELEDLLRTAEVVSAHETKEGGSGPKILFLERDETKLKAVWRPAQMYEGEQFRAELGAYELDKLLSLEMVPPTVERPVGGKKGALQLWVQDCRAYKKLEGQTPATTAWSRELSRMKMFDYLIGNRDRNSQNILIDPNDEVILVDHLGSFSGGHDLAQLPLRFDRRLLAKLRELSRDELQIHLKRILSAEEIENILARRDALLSHIEKLVAEKGEAAVIF